MFGSPRVNLAGSPDVLWLRVSAEGRRSRLFAQHAFTVNTDWAQFRYSDSHSGFNPYENVLSAADASRIGENWSFHTNGNGFESSPAVVGGVVYVGSLDGNLYAFSLPGAPAAPARPTRSSLHPS